MIRWALFLLLAGFVAWFFGFVEVAAMADHVAEILIVVAIVSFLFYRLVARKPTDPMDERFIGKT